MTDLLAIAEAPAAHIEPRHPRVVIADGYVVSQMGPRDGSVQAIRLREDRLDETRAAVHALARERKWQSVAWWVSDLSEPPDVGERFGLVADRTLTALAAVAKTGRRLDRRRAPRRDRRAVRRGAADRPDRAGP